jgi:hypothetical protein
MPSFSAKEPELIVGRELLEELGCKMYLHSDRGAYSGKVQVVTEYLEELLAREKLDQLYTCGSRRLGRFLLDCGWRGELRDRFPWRKGWPAAWVLVLAV